MTVWWKRHEVAVALLIDVFLFLALGGLSVIFTLAGLDGWGWFTRFGCATTLADAYMVNRTGRAFWMRRPPKPSGDDD